MFNNLKEDSSNKNFSKSLVFQRKNYFEKYEITNYILFFYFMIVVFISSLMIYSKYYYNGYNFYGPWFYLFDTFFLISASRIFYVLVITYLIGSISFLIIFKTGYNPLKKIQLITLKTIILAGIFTLLFLPFIFVDSFLFTDGYFSNFYSVLSIPKIIIYNFILIVALIGYFIVKQLLKKPIPTTNYNKLRSK